MKLAIFDFDGTIADTLPRIIEIGNKYGNHYKLPKLTPSLVTEIRGMNIKSILKKYNLPLYKLPFLIRDIQKELSNHIEEIEPFPGIKKVLEDLTDSGYDLAIMSSNSSNNIKTFLDYHNFPKFKAIRSSRNIFRKAKSINKIIRKLNYTNKTSIYIGDEVRDIEACQKIQLPIVAVSWGYNNKEILAKYNPDFLVDSPKELYKTLLNF